MEVAGVATVFVGPGFLTVTKEENFDWEVITKDIVSIFDKL